MIFNGEELIEKGLYIKEEKAPQSILIKYKSIIKN
jgi:hypothetical protein